MTYWYILICFEYWVQKLLRGSLQMYEEHWERLSAGMAQIWNNHTRRITRKHHFLERNQQGSDFHKLHLTPLPKHSDSHCPAPNLKGHRRSVASENHKAKAADGTVTMHCSQEIPTWWKQLLCAYIVFYFK